MTGLGEAAVLDAWTVARHDDRAALIDRLGRLALGESAPDSAWDDATRAFLEIAAASGPLEVVADCPSCGMSVEAPVPFAALARAHDDASDERGTDGPAPPRLGDMVAVARMSPADAADELAARCGLDRLDDAERAVTTSRWDRERVLLAPSLEATCPACGTAVELPIDALALAWAAISDLTSAVLDDVAALASGFGWTEGEVLAVPAPRRRWYRDALDGAGRRG